MKIKKARYLTATLVLLLLLAGCYREGIPTEPEVEGAYRIESFISVGAKTAVFKTTGAIDDEGTVEGEPLPVDEEIGTRVVRYRMFDSAIGYIAVRVEAHYVKNGVHIVEGAFSVLGSTGVYTNVQKQGAFHALLDGKDDPVEYFSGLLY